MTTTPSAEENKEKLQLVYTDICDPNQTQSFGRSRHFITFTDDFSHYHKIYFLKALEKFQAIQENDSGLKSKAFQSNRGGEYISEEFQGMWN